MNFVEDFSQNYDFLLIIYFLIYLFCWIIDYKLQNCMIKFLFKNIYIYIINFIRLKEMWI